MVIRMRFNSFLVKSGAFCGDIPPIRISKTLYGRPMRWSQLYPDVKNA